MAPLKNSDFAGNRERQALRQQAIHDIENRVDELSVLTDGRNVEGFSAMRAVGKYVVHSIISEEDFTALFYEAYRKNGLFQKIGHNAFMQTVRRALAGCQTDPAPKLRKGFSQDVQKALSSVLTVYNHDESIREPKPFSDHKLITQGYRLVETYQYQAPDNQSAYQKLRYQPCEATKTEKSKAFLVRHQGEDGRWYNGRGAHPDYPYHLQDMLNNRLSPVLVCEGEKDADTAKSLGFLSVSVTNWQQCVSFFKDRDIILVPDNDEAGRKKADYARTVLGSIAQTISCLKLPNLNEKEDLTDWVQRGGTGADLGELIRQVLPEKTPQARKGTDYQLANGKPVVNRYNIALALDKLGISLSCNQLTDTIEISGLEGFGQFSDLAVNRMRYELWEQEGLKVQKEAFYDFVADIAQQNAYHPIKDYLNDLTWDGIPRVERFFIDIAGAEDTRLNRRITEIWFTAAVRRILEPGTDFQELVVLEGKQGKGKSTGIRKLCPDESWFSDDLPLNASSKTIVELTLGKWIIEAAELTGRNQDTRALKRFLSTTTDRTRLAYERVAKDFPRQWVIIGTTNESEYLVDSTGNRRFWPMRVQSFHLEKITPHYRDQLWAEAIHLHQGGSELKLESELWDEATAEQDKRFNNDPWEEVLSGLLPKEDCTIIASSVFEALCIPQERRDRRASLRIGYIMRKLGFIKTGTRHPHTGKMVRVWKSGKGGALGKLTFSGFSYL